MGSKMKHIVAKAVTTIMLGLFLTGCATNQEKYDNAILEAMVDPLGWRKRGLGLRV